MFRTLARSALLVALTAGGLAAQGWEVSPFRPLALPGPNMYRTGSGRPGPGYWQQRVDYQIKASLDSAETSIALTHCTLEIQRCLKQTGFRTA